MTPVSCRHRWHGLTQAQWAALRAQFVDYLYPSGALTAGADTVEHNYTGIPLPTGCSHISRYEITHPGGRLCTPSQYAYLFHPTVTPVGTCMTVCDGHGGFITSCYESYLPANCSQQLIALSLGWHVIEVPLIGCDYAYDVLWQQPGGWHVTYGGSLQSMTGHAFGPLVSDGGPNPTRLFMDVAIRAAIEAQSEVHPSKWVLCGYSGGAVTCPWVFIADPRYKYMALLGTNPPISAGGLAIINAADTEQMADFPGWTGGPAVRDVWGAIALGCSIPGRRVAIHNGTQDANFPSIMSPTYEVNTPTYNQSMWLAETAQLNGLANDCGSSVTYRFPHEVHANNPARMTWLFNDIAGHI